jgi:hypothetical protein
MIAEYYDNDYLGNDIQDLYRLSKELVGALDHGNFEWDTFYSDSLLSRIKYTINKIDI